MTTAMLDDARGAIATEDLARATHVIEENARVIEAVEALRSGDLQAVGTLFNASHDSLRDLYDVSGPALEIVVGAARRHPRCFGARLTGAGFGGCAIALVDAADTDAFVQGIRSVLAEALPSFAGAFVAGAAEGARIA